MTFSLWLESKIGSTATPLYHAHPDVRTLVKKGFTGENINSSGLASVAVSGQRISYGAAGGIHLTRSLNFAISFAKKYGKQGGVVEVYFHVRKPFYVPEQHTVQGKTHFRCFVNPEDHYLVPLGGSAGENIDRIAATILRMRTARQIYEKEGTLGTHSSPQNAPYAIMVKQLAREFYMPIQGMRRTGWPPDFREANPSFEEEPFATLGTHEWKKWADKGYIDSVWWGNGGGPFHGEQEVTVFDPRRLRVGSIVYEN